MTTSRASWAAAQRLLPRLSQRDQQILHSLASARVLTGHQLNRLHFHGLSSHTQHRTTRLVLKRLTDSGVLMRLDRVIGGVRAGSTGWVYSLAPLGHRLIQLQAGQRDSQRIRTPWTPSLLFLKHSLDVAELFVQLTERSRHGGYQLASFTTEPGCWWPDGLGGWLKPDAHLVLRTAEYDELIWLEVDRATESLTSLKRQLRSYTDFVARGLLGPGGVMPHVAISTVNNRRANDIQTVVESLDDKSALFIVDTFERITQRIETVSGITPLRPP